MDLKKVFQWMRSGDSGASSTAIAMHMTSGWCDGAYPHDPADLGRCLRLLERFPEWKRRIGEMADYGFVWAAYVEHWQEMADCMASEVGVDWSKGGSAEKTYDLMHRIVADAYRNNPDYECTFSKNGHLRSAWRVREAA